MWRSTRQEASPGCGTITTAPWPDTSPARCPNVRVFKSSLGEIALIYYIYISVF